MLPPFSEYEADRAMMACQVPASTPAQKSAQDLLRKALLPAQGIEQLDISQFCGNVAGTFSQCGF